jgi:hypothetical protein
VALSAPADVRRRGGLNDVEAFELFRVEDEAELDDLLAEDIALAVAWLQERVDTAYYTGSATGSAGRDIVFKRAEILLTLHFALMPLKTRRVMGTHWGVDQEGSDRFAELIDNEFLKQASLLIEEFTVIETTDTPFVLPAIMATNDFDRSEILDQVTQNQAVIDESLGLVGVTE